MTVKDTYLEKVILLVQDRLTFLEDFWNQSFFFFQAPSEYDFGPIKSKWTKDKTDFFDAYIQLLKKNMPTDAKALEDLFKSLAEENKIKTGELMLPFRIMLVGGKFGPGVFDIAHLLGIEETNKRIQKALTEL